jgi:hypothetical protein
MASLVLSLSLSLVDGLPAEAASELAHADARARCAPFRPAVRVSQAAADQFEYVGRCERPFAFCAVRRPRA